MKRYWPGVAMVALPLAVFAVLVVAKAQGMGPRVMAFALEGTLSFWPQALWQEAAAYPGQRFGMFASYGLIHRSATELLLAVCLTLVLSARAAGAAGGWRAAAAFLAGLLLAPLLQGLVSGEPVSGMAGGVAGLAGALAVWTRDRPVGPRVAPLSVLALGAGVWFLSQSPPALVAGGLAAGALAALALKGKGAAPGGGA